MVKNLIKNFGRIINDHFFKTSYLSLTSAINTFIANILALIDK